MKGRREMNNIGTHIKNFRNKEGLSQAQFAEYFPDIGMKQEHVSFYEHGKRSIPPEVYEAMVVAGVIPKATIEASERVKQMVDSMSYEDQTLVEHFVRRMMK